MNILVLNCGSSSVKFQIIATDLDAIARDDDQRLARGTIERIGGEAIIAIHSEGLEKKLSTAPLRDTQSAVEWIIRWACSQASISSIKSPDGGDHEEVKVTLMPCSLCMTINIVANRNADPTLPRFGTDCLPPSTRI